jgi:hypothetical protein
LIYSGHNIVTEYGKSYGKIIGIQIQRKDLCTKEKSKKCQGYQLSKKYSPTKSLKK